MVTFTSGFARTYSEAWRFLVALPFLGVAIIGVEGLQHLVEWRAGMFVSSAGAHHAATDMGRMVFGSVKVLWIELVTFWVLRFFVSGSADTTLRAGREAVRRYAVVMIVMAALALITLWPPVLAPAQAQRTVSLVLLAVQLVIFPLEAALTPWMVGAALGDRRADIGFSLRRAWGSIWWALALSLLTAVPLMVVHYALNLGAVGQPTPVAAIMLAADAVFVGYLGVAIGTAQAVVAQRMAERAGDALVVLA